MRFDGINKAIAVGTNYTIWKIVIAAETGDQYGNWIYSPILSSLPQVGALPPNQTYRAAQYRRAPGVPGGIEIFIAASAENHPLYNYWTQLPAAYGQPTAGSMYFTSNGEAYKITFDNLPYWLIAVRIPTGTTTQPPFDIGTLYICISE